MPFVVTCPTCRHPLTVDEASAGQTVACPTCRAPLGVPAAAVPVAPQSSDPFDLPEDDSRSKKRFDREKKPGSNLTIFYVVVGILVALVMALVLYDRIDNALIRSRLGKVEDEIILTDGARMSRESAIRSRLRDASYEQERAAFRADTEWRRLTEKFDLLFAERDLLRRKLR